MSEGEGTAGTIIKGKRKLSNEERKTRESLALENRRAQGTVSLLAECNTKHPLNDDAVICTTRGKCLQHSRCICCSVEKKQITQSTVFPFMQNYTHTYTRTHLLLSHLHVQKFHLWDMDLGFYLYFPALFEFLRAYILFIIIFKGKREGYAQSSKWWQK